MVGKLILTENMKNNLTGSRLSDAIVRCANINAAFVTIHALNE